MIKIAMVRKLRGRPLNGSDATNRSTSRVRFDVETGNDIPDFYVPRTATVHRSNQRPRCLSQQYDSGFGSSFAPSQTSSNRGFARQRAVRQSTLNESFEHDEPLVELSNQRAHVPQPGSEQ